MKKKNWRQDELVRLDLKRNCNDSNIYVYVRSVKVIGKTNVMTHFKMVTRDVEEVQETSARERAAARTEIC